MSRRIKTPHLKYGFPLQPQSLKTWHNFLFISATWGFSVCMAVKKVIPKPEFFYSIECSSSDICLFYLIFSYFVKFDLFSHFAIYIDIHTGAGHIIRISSKSWFISLKKWNLYNVYIHSTQIDIFQVFISNFDDYNWQLMKTPNSVSQKIWILLKTNTKKGFVEILANWKVWTWKVWACTALNT